MSGKPHIQHVAFPAAEFGDAMRILGYIESREFAGLRLNFPERAKICFLETCIATFKFIVQVENRRMRPAFEMHVVKVPRVAEFFLL